MSVLAHRVILDTNVIVRALADEYSPAGLMLRLCLRRRVVPLVSRSTLREYRDVLTHPDMLQRLLQRPADEIDTVLDQLLYVADRVDPVRVRFKLPRDPGDEHLLELAIQGRATALITYDPDLLALPLSKDDAGRRFRQRLRRLAILTPGAFLARFEERL